MAIYTVGRRRVIVALLLTLILLLTLDLRGNAVLDRVRDALPSQAVGRDDLARPRHFQAADPRVGLGPGVDGDVGVRLVRGECDEDVGGVTRNRRHDRCSALDRGLGQDRIVERGSEKEGAAQRSAVPLDARIVVDHDHGGSGLAEMLGYRSSEAAESADDHVVAQ